MPLNLPFISKGWQGSLEQFFYNRELGQFPFFVVISITPLAPLEP